MKPKGYVKFFNVYDPITWEGEEGTYVYNVRKVKNINGKWVKDKRLYDKRVNKKDIFKKPYSA